MPCSRSSTQSRAAFRTDTNVNIVAHGELPRGPEVQMAKAMFRQEDEVKRRVAGARTGVSRPRTRQPGVDLGPELASRDHFECSGFSSRRVRRLLRNPGAGLIPIQTARRTPGSVAPESISVLAARGGDPESTATLSDPSETHKLRPRRPDNPEQQPVGFLARPAPKRPLRLAGIAG